MNTKNTLHSLKVFGFAILVLGFFAPLHAKELPGLDKSPADISAFPKKGEKLVKVVYSRPMANGRTVFDELVQYDKVWRTGANEATEVTFYQDASINGQKVAKGTYSVFTIPGKEKWTLILNKGLNQWGAFQYNEKDDVLRTEVEASSRKDFVEAFTMAFTPEKKKDKTNWVMAWEKTQVEIPVKF